MLRILIWNIEISGNRHLRHVGIFEDNSIEDTYVQIDNTTRVINLDTTHYFRTVKIPTWAILVTTDENSTWEYCAYSMNYFTPDIIIPVEGQKYKLD